jgi:hypothetical protein
MHYAVFSCRLGGCLIRWLPHFAMLKIRSATIILVIIVCFIAEFMACHNQPSSFFVPK